VCTFGIIVIKFIATIYVCTVLWLQLKYDEDISLEYLYFHAHILSEYAKKEEEEKMTG